jgi:TetR/AcrR family transcriptional regulator, copper-responsive repressor
MVQKEDNDVMAIGRPKNFSRVEVMEKSIPVFWEHGFADTSLADLEAATGVDRSGLYSEFRDKEDLFLASLGHYIETSGLTDTLATKPLGWTNVEKYLKLGLACWSGQKGCFAVSAMRELAILPAGARLTVEKSMKPIRRLLISNIEAEKTTMDSSGLADMTMTFFSGLSIEQNLATNRQSGLKRIEMFMQVMRAL